jgi:acylpyruvate hydrolase
VSRQEDSAGLEDAWRERFGRPRPGKVVCVGLNYRTHALETNAELPERPLLFAKFANAVVGEGEPILLPDADVHVDAEAELAVVIGAHAARVPVERALEVVHGYTAANDVSARDFQFADGQWLRGKGFDSFCPILADVVPVAELGPAGDLRVVQRLNGEVLQDGRTSDLIFDVPTLVAYVSDVMTLDPGDLILTGTPAGVGYFREPRIPLRDGDEVEVEIEGIGTLRNPVRVRD